MTTTKTGGSTATSKSKGKKEKEKISGKSDSWPTNTNNISGFNYILAKNSKNNRAI